MKDLIECMKDKWFWRMITGFIVFVLSPVIVLLITKITVGEVDVWLKMLSGASLVWLICIFIWTSLSDAA